LPPPRSRRKDPSGRVDRFPLAPRHVRYSPFPRRCGAAHRTSRLAPLDHRLDDERLHGSAPPRRGWCARRAPGIATRRPRADSGHCRDGDGWRFPGRTEGRTSWSRFLRTAANSWPLG
jgi:hypothetical protein